MDKKKGRKNVFIGKGKPLSAFGCKRKI